MKQFKSIVLQGDKTGRTIGFPTINLQPNIFPKDFKTGIYACVVYHDNETYKGALYFGPRLVKNEEKNVLEIHLLDFDQEIYDHEIMFEVYDHIRDVKNFGSLDELKAEIARDIQKIRKILLD